MDSFVARLILLGTAALRGPIRLGQMLRTGLEYRKMHSPEVQHRVYTNIGIPASIGLSSTLLVFMFGQGWLFVLWTAALALGLIGYFDATLDKGMTNLQGATGSFRSGPSRPVKQTIAISLLGLGLIMIVIGIHSLAADTGTSTQAVFQPPPNSVLHQMPSPYFNLTGYGWRFSSSYELDLLPSTTPFYLATPLKPRWDLAWNYLDNVQAQVIWRVGQNHTYTIGGPIRYGTGSWYEIGGVDQNEAVPNQNFIQVDRLGEEISFQATQQPVRLRVELWYK